MIDLYLNIDIKSLPEAEARQKIDDINKVSEFFCNQKSFDDSIYCSENALIMSERINYTKGIAEAKKNIGEVNYRRSEFKDAMLNLSEAAKLFDEINEKGNQAKTYINLAISHRYLDDYITMIELCFKALTIFRETNDEYNEGFILNIIGNYYLEVRQYNLAIEYYTMSLKIQRKQKNIRRIMLVIYNIGLGYYNLGLHSTDSDEKFSFYGKALVYYNTAYDFNLRIDKDKFLRTRILRNIAMAYGSQEKYEKSEEIFLECLEYFTKKKDKLEVCETLTDLGKLYVDMKSNEKAGNTLYEAEKLAVELESKRLQLAVAWKFHDLFRNQKKFYNAFTYYKKLSVIEFERNNTLIEDNIRKLNIMHKVDITKKETEMLSEKNEHLRALNEKLVKLNNEKNYFLNLAGNDLKLPLQNISELVSDIKKQNSVEKLSSILEESSHMQKIISHLLTINETETVN
jgi:tetratricopeptide (TPR) repeat protein